jgi:hypothetical protein
MAAPSQAPTSHADHTPTQHQPNRKPSCHPGTPPIRSTLRLSSATGRRICLASESAAPPGPRHTQVLCKRCVHSGSDKTHQHNPQDIRVHSVHAVGAPERQRPEEALHTKDTQHRQLSRGFRPAVVPGPPAPHHTNKLESTDQRLMPALQTLTAAHRVAARRLQHVTAAKKRKSMPKGHMVLKLSRRTQSALR